MYVNSWWFSGMGNLAISACERGCCLWHICAICIGRTAVCMISSCWHASSAWGTAEGWLHASWMSLQSRQLDVTYWHKRCADKSSTAQLYSCDTDLASKNAKGCPSAPPIHTASNPFQNLFPGSSFSLSDSWHQSASDSNMVTQQMHNIDDQAQLVPYVHGKGSC